MNILTEGNHTLVTPQFSGSAAEIMCAARAWLDIIERLRLLEAQVTSFENRASIILHLSREVESLKLSLDNTSAKLTTIDNVTQLKQELPGEEAVTKDRLGFPSDNMKAVELNKPVRAEALGEKLKRFNASLHEVS